jgi:hypothetical protein
LLGAAPVAERLLRAAYGAPTAEMPFFKWWIDSLGVTILVRCSVQPMVPTITSTRLDQTEAMVTDPCFSAGLTLSFSASATR